MPFSEQTLFLGVALALTLAALAALVIIYLQRRRIRYQLIEQVDELETLSEVGRIIVASELDLMALSHLIADEAGKIIDNSTFQIGLFEAHYYTILYWRVAGEMKTTPVTYDLNDSAGLVSEVRHQRESLLIHNLSAELENLPSKPRYLTTSSAESAIYIPLLSAGEVIGIMAAQHAEPNRFKQADMRRLTILANHAAAAIDNATLYEQARARAEDLEMVSRLAWRVNDFSSQDRIFDETVQQIRDRLNCNPVTIWQMDSDSPTLILRAGSLVSEWTQPISIHQKQGLIGAAATQRKTIITNNVSGNTQYLPEVGAAVYDAIATTTKSEIAVPLIVEGEILGVLDVQSDQIGRFSAREKALLIAIANELSNAAIKARQRRQQLGRAWLATVQWQVSRAISGSRQLPRMLDGITRLTSMLLGTSMCAVLVWDENSCCYCAASIDGVSAETKTHFMRTRLAIGDWSPLDAAHVAKTPLTTQKPLPWGAKTDTPTEIYPLLYQTHPIGALLVHHATDQPRRRHIVELHREILAHISDQTAQAIHTHQLRQAQREEAWVNAALLQVAESINRLIDLNEILHAIVRLVSMFVGVDLCLILIWDEAKKSFRPGPSIGVSQMGLGLIDAFEFDMSEFKSVRVQAHSELTEDTLDNVDLPTWIADAVGTDTLQGMELYAQNKMVGVMFVGPTTDGKPISGRRLSILSGIGQQAAIAVVNDRLYRESAEQERLQQEIRVARSIQASLIPDGNPDIPRAQIAGFWQAARQVSGDFYDFLELPDGKWAIVIADVADKGVAAALFMALSRTIIRTVGFNRVDPAATLMRANELILNDTESDLFVTVFYAVWDPATGELAFANGGHNPPLLLKKDGSAETIGEYGIALGVIGGITLKRQSIQLQAGETVIFYTDGVTEAMTADYDEFTLARLQATVSGLQMQQATEIRDAITDAVEAHVDGTTQSDDITLVVMKITE